MGCDDHRPVQHRDGKEPWCESCRLTKDFRHPRSLFGPNKDAPSADEDVLAKAKAEAWDEGRRAGQKYERSAWQWQAGSLSRAVNGLTERPTAPVNPYIEKGQVQR